MLIFFDRIAQYIREAEGTHLRAEIVGRHLLARYQQAILTLKWGLDAPVEEVCHMRVLLRLGRLEHRLACLGHHFRHDVLHRLRREGDRYVERAVV